MNVLSIKNNPFCRAKIPNGLIIVIMISLRGMVVEIVLNNPEFQELLPVVFEEMKQTAKMFDEAELMPTIDPRYDAGRKDKTEGKNKDKIKNDKPPATAKNIKIGR